MNKPRTVAREKRGTGSLERMVGRLATHHAKTQEKNRAAISKMFDGVKPYTAEDMAEKIHTVKVHVRGIGWVEVKTTTQFVCNGMLKQAAAKIEAGEYTKCSSPKRGERIVRLSPNADLSEPGAKT